MKLEPRDLPPLPPWAPQTEAGNGHRGWLARAREYVRVPDRIARPFRLESENALRWRAGAVVAVAVVAFVALLAGAYAVDMWVHRGRVVDNVVIGDTAVGGLAVDAAAREVDAAADEMLSTPVDARVGGTDVEIAPATLGVEIDTEAALARADDVGRRGNVGRRIFDWVRSRTTGVDIDWPVRVDDERAVPALEAIDFPERVEFSEPTISFEEDVPTVVDGTEGFLIDADAALPLVTTAVVQMPRERVELPVASRSPRYSWNDANAALAAANGWFQDSIRVELLEGYATLDTEEIKSILHTTAGSDGLRVRVDPERLQEVVAENLPNTGTRPKNAGYTIDEAGNVAIVDAANGNGCCGPGSVESVEAALAAVDPDDRVARLTATELTPTYHRADLEAYATPVKLAEFTTNHAAGGERVFNIHKLADIMRGLTVMPGEQFSVNEYIGPRTSAGGWASAGVIEDGVFTTSPGGGISQFATTMYNALYFAGLQVDEHRAHSIYISRYPKGREATFGYPKPDLVFTNDMPGPVFVWPRYTSTSITVEIWGIGDGRTAESIGPETSRRGACQVVKDTRIIRWPDGREEQQEQWTTYRPEGRGC